MADLTALAFELADRYRNPAFILADGFNGQMMEPVEFPQTAVAPHQPEWPSLEPPPPAATSSRPFLWISTTSRLTTVHSRPSTNSPSKNETRAETWQTDDAEIVLVGYGIVGRILKAVTAEARAAGIKVGVLRPITLYPFPISHFQRLAQRSQVFVVVEMSNGQLLEDVRLALNGVRPVEFLNRCGGNVPSHDEVLALVHKLCLRTRPQPATSRNGLRFTEFPTQFDEESVAHV